MPGPSPRLSGSEKPVVRPVIAPRTVMEFDAPRRQWPLTPALSPRAGRGRDPRSGRVRGGEPRNTVKLPNETGEPDSRGRVPAIYVLSLARIAACVDARSKSGRHELIGTHAISDCVETLAADGRAGTLRSSFLRRAQIGGGEVGTQYDLGMPRTC